MITAEINNLRELFDKKEYAKALEIAVRLANDNGGNNELNLELAKLYFVTGQFELSEKIFIFLQRNEMFSKISTDMLQKAYKMLGRHADSVKQFYKLIKKNAVDVKNTDDVLDSLLTLKRYSTALKVLKFSEKNKIYSPEFVCKKNSEIYSDMVMFICDSNAGHKYETVKKIYRKTADFIPSKEKKIKNILLNEYEIASGKTILDSKPRVLTVELTNKCNLKCKMCEYKRVKQCWEISDNNCNELMELMPYLEHLVLQGGEVFLYKRIGEIIERAVKENVILEIVTNGLLLNREIMALLINGNAILTFSIDGVTKNVYENIRIGGKFEKLLSNLRDFSEMRKKINNNCILRLHMVVMRSNYDQIEEVINFAGKYNFNELYLEPVANKYIERDESVFETGYDGTVVSALENKKELFEELAKEKSLKLINHLPTLKYCESVFSAGKAGWNEEMRNKKHIKDFLWIFRKRTVQNNAYNYSSKIYDHKILKTINCQRMSGELFCYAPWHKMAVFNRRMVVPTCYCPHHLGALELNPALQSLKNKIECFLSGKTKNAIQRYFNGKTMVYYRKSVISKNENISCSRDCLFGRISRNERDIIHKF